jgi:hypothetical protein
MAGTLTVQNLQGPSSGANANKIIVPSGQTIEIDSITGLSGADVLDVVDYSYTPPAWSYSTTVVGGANIYGTTFTLPKRSLVLCSSSGHMSNSGNTWNILADIDIDGDINFSMVYPNYKGQYYHAPSANNNTWQGFQLTKNKVLDAGSHTVSLRAGPEGADTISVNGSSLRITALELI